MKRIAFVGNALKGMEQNRTRLFRIMEKLQKVQADTEDMKTNFSAMSADDHADNLKAANKKINKAVQLVNDALDMFNSIYEAIDGSMPINDKEVANDDDDQEDSMDDGIEADDDLDSDESSDKGEEKEASDDEIPVTDDKDDDDSVADDDDDDSEDKSKKKDKKKDDDDDIDVE